MQNYPTEYPQAIDAEKWLLGGILQDPKSFEEISVILVGSEFYYEKNQAVWEAMRELRKEGNPIDIITISNELEKLGKLSQIGGKDYLFALMESVSSAANAISHARIIHDKFVLRSLVSTSNETIKDALAPMAETADVLQAAEKRIFDIAANQVKENIQPISDAVDNVLDILHKGRSGHDVTGCDTGFKDLNTLTDGLQKGDLIILAARPSMGKTAFALNIAGNAAAKGLSVLFFSLEMNARQLATRILSSISGVDLEKISKGFISSGESHELFMKAEELRKLPLFIDDSSEVNSLDLLSKCRVFKRKNKEKLDLIVVDYLQMMKINSRSENRASGVAENSRMLKVLAKELDVPVLALAQLNRNVENRPTGGRPQLSDLRDSGSIEQDADMVWFIHRPIKEKEKKKSKDESWEPSIEEIQEAWLLVAKHRNGPTRDIRLKFVGEKTTFYDYFYDNQQNVADSGFSGDYND